MIYQTRPVRVQAIQLTDAMVAAHLLHSESLPPGVNVARASFNRGKGKVNSCRVVVVTDKGTKTVKSGDWIVTDEFGQRTVCKEADFDALYEPVTA